MAKYPVAMLSELKESSLKRVEANGTAICLARLADGQVFAIDDTCTHEQIELSDGTLDDDVVECPLHGSCFSVRTGEVTGLPATEPVATYPVTVEDGEVFVEV
jgi:3-phenylpropionate/trans-cinnamate dioxygenase ferredoxin subunit